MAETANITSLDAIEAFRAAQIVYLGKARPLLEEISGEITRMRQWLEDDQRRHWENQLRLRSRKLEEARAELFNATLSKLATSTALKQMDVQRADRAVRESEGKLKMVRKWSRELENRTGPLVKQIEQFQTYLATDMAQATAYLDRVRETLEAYASVGPGKKS
jgi:predicted  nucleic acid-binding Zn-ribbon protein